MNIMFEGHNIKHDEPRLAIDLDFRNLIYEFHLKKCIEERNRIPQYKESVTKCLDLLKNSYNEEHDVSRIRFRNSFSESAMVNIISFLKQGLEIFDSSRRLTILSKPFIVYYAHLNLIKALIYSTLTNIPNQFNSHGLRHNHNEIYKTSVKKTGFYTLFLCCLGDTDLLKEALRRDKNNKYSFADIIFPLPELKQEEKVLTKYSTFLNQVLLISFILGMITRYHPLSIHKKEMGQEISYIMQINRFYAELAEHEFKIGLLSFFQGKLLAYRRPSYW